MYPFDGERTFPRQHWYIAAWSDEVGRTLLERTLLDERVVLYRAEDGTVVAMQGVCPHRMMPLARGRLEGDSVRCGYHGFVFDRSGQCTQVPGQEKVPRCALRVYPTVERGPWVWIWLGDPERADPARLPDLASTGLGVPGWRADRNGSLLLKARYALLLDNLMDLTHVNYVHADTIGVMDTLNEPLTMTELDGAIRAGRRLRDQPVSGPLAFLHPGVEERVDIEMFSEFLGVGLVNAAGPNCTTQSGHSVGRMHFIHGVTPETAHTTHYFFVCARDFRVEDEALTAAILHTSHAALMQDVETLETIEPLADRHGNVHTEISAAADGGALRVRRRLVAWMRAEQQ